MDIHKMIAFLLATSFWSASMERMEGQPAPTLGPSAFCVGTNEGLYLIGHNLVPGEQVTGNMTEATRDGPWIFHADTNGDLMVNITAREFVYAWGPPRLQSYFFNSAETHIHVDFSAWIQANDQHTNDWHAVITSLNISQYDSSDRIELETRMVPANAYQVQVATNLTGPWSFAGWRATSMGQYPRSIPIYWPHTNYYMFPVYPSQAGIPPNQKQLFFRIANPDGPCPCDFDQTNQP